VPESGSLGSARGAASNGRPYRERRPHWENRPHRSSGSRIVVLALYFVQLNLGRRCCDNREVNYGVGS
jgi:hypothetical protein